jgi:hypothetical protein
MFLVFVAFFTEYIKAKNTIVIFDCQSRVSNLREGWFSFKSLIS